MKMVPVKTLQIKPLNADYVTVLKSASYRLLSHLS